MFTLRGPGVADLPVFMTQADDGTPVIISCWMLNTLDMDMLQETRRLWLVTLGTKQPPVKMQTVKPYGTPLNIRLIAQCDYLDSQREVWDE